MTDRDPFSQPELLRRIQAGWDDLTAYLNTLTEEQLTRPADAAGWTAKDHVIHMAVWEDGVYGLLEGQTQRERMNIDKETWATHDDDRINAVIQQRHKDMPLPKVLQTLHEVHNRLIAKIESLTTEDLEKPYSAYDTSSKATDPVWGWIVGNTFGHYAQHRPWIEAIVARA